MGESFYMMVYDFLCNSDMLCYAGIHNTRIFFEVLHFDKKIWLIFMLQKQHKVNLRFSNFRIRRPQDFAPRSYFDGPRLDGLWHNLDDVTGFRIAPMTSQRCLGRPPGHFLYSGFFCAHLRTGENTYMPRQTSKALL